MKLEQQLNLLKEDIRTLLHTASVHYSQLLDFQPAKKGKLLQTKEASTTVSLI